MGCGCGRDGGWSRSAEFEQWFQWKFEQFQRRIVWWRRRRGMVSAPDYTLDQVSSGVRVPRGPLAIGPSASNATRSIAIHYEHGSLLTSYKFQYVLVPFRLS